jgi:chromosome partitioning protein
MAIVAIANQKGGVGKTATAVNLGAALAAAGRSVLLVDLDAQANLSLSCGITAASGQPTTYELLMDQELGAKAAIVTTAWEGLAVLPASEALAAAQVQLAGAPRPTERLREKLRPLRNGGAAQVPAEAVGASLRLPRALQHRGAATPYEYILIDTPPSLGFLTLNALTAADWVLIPVQASFLALHGMRQLTQTAQSVQGHTNASLRVGGVLLTMYDGRTVHAQQVQSRLQQHFGETLFETVVRRSVAFDYATVAGVPLVFHQPGHPSAEAYRQLAQEVMTRAQDA